MRQPLVVGNWKMQGSRTSVESLLGCLVSATPAAAAEVAVCPSFVHLAQALGFLQAVLCWSGRSGLQLYAIWTLHW